MANNMINEFKEYLGIKHDNPFTILEAKATETKTTKEVSEKEVAGYDYKNEDNLDNQIFDQYLKGLRVEMEQNPDLLADNPSEALLKAKEIVLKNLKKDPIFYTKNAAFGIKGLGYETSTEPQEPTGKHKASGYGDLKENNMKKSEQLKELLEEAVAGMAALILTRQSAIQSQRLGIGSGSRVLLIGTEGATDPALYRALVAR